MSEIGKTTIITTPSISKASKTIDNLPVDSKIEGMKSVAFLERKITEKEKEQAEIKANPVIEEEKIPTGAEIRQDREEGEYR